MSEVDMGRLRALQSQLSLHRVQCIDLEGLINEEVDLDRIISLNNKLAAAEAKFNDTLREMSLLEAVIKRYNASNPVPYAALSQPTHPRSERISIASGPSPSPVPAARDEIPAFHSNPSLSSDEIYAPVAPRLPASTADDDVYAPVCAPAARAPTNGVYAPGDSLPDTSAHATHYNPALPTEPVSAPVVQSEAESTRPAGWEGAWPLITTRQMQEFAKWNSKRGSSAVGA